MLADAQSVDVGVDAILHALRAVAEPTRLRILVLCARTDLTVTDLTAILGQSQPRVSRHLRIMCESGVLRRDAQATRAFFRLADDMSIADAVLGAVPVDDPAILGDLRRLQQVKAARAARARTYFRAHAASWNHIRGLHVDPTQVEAALADLWPAADEPIDRDAAPELLDIGTGTGRMLRLFAPRVRGAVGIDTSPEMLNIARADLDAAGLRHCFVRQGDMYALPWASPSFDVVTMHMVLHYAEDPAAAIAEAARVLRPGGSLLIADFAPHQVEQLRIDHAHHWLGLPSDDVVAWCRAAGLSCGPVRALAGDPLTVNIWSAAPPAGGVKPQTLHSIQ